MDAFECSVCGDLFLEPVTAPCGHSFCRKCLARSLDHKSECPLCRCIMLGDFANNAKVSVSLAEIMQIHVPEDARVARAARDEATPPSPEGASNTTPMPMFVMQAVLPQPAKGMSLYIFEPRYRLLVRRVMEGSRRFGMMALDQDPEMECATEVQIEYCRTLPDGRFHIGIKPTGRRVRCVSKTRDECGYVLGHVEECHDLDDATYVRINEGMGVRAEGQWRTDTNKVSRDASDTNRKHLEHLPEFAPDGEGWIYACDLPLDVLVEELQACVVELTTNLTAVLEKRRTNTQMRLDVFKEVMDVETGDPDAISWQLCDAVSRISGNDVWHDFVREVVSSASVRERLVMCRAPIYLTNQGLLKALTEEVES